MKLALQPRQAEPASATAETAAASPSPGSPRLPSLLSCLVHPAVSVGIILASVALAVWILSVRLPVLRKPLPVQARASGTGDSPKAVPTEVLAEWRVRGQPQQACTNKA